LEALLNFDNHAGISFHYNNLELSIDPKKVHTLFAVSSSFAVKLPVPGPISNTTSVEVTPAFQDKENNNKIAPFPPYVELLVDS